MLYEKIYPLTVSREAKIIIHGSLLKKNKEIFIDFEFLVKDSGEDYFHKPIGSDHPKYWKLQRLDTERAQLLQMEYSGISKKQFYAAIKEFRDVVGTGYTITYNSIIQERIKSLKGIRLTAFSKGMLAAS